MPSPPDLTVDLPTVSDSSPRVGQSLTLNVIVRNQGSGSSGPTRLSYHRSTDSTVTPNDPEVGTVQVSGVDASGSSAESFVTQAPDAPGTYYYGVCAGPLSSESDTTNNCSDAVAVTVLPPPPDLLVDMLTVSDSSPMAGQSLTLNVIVRNQGDGASGPTTLSFYRSSDSAITPDDPELGTVQISGLDASGSGAESFVTQAPDAPGTYYYGVCVSPLPSESDTTNNCSAALAIRVRPPPPDMEVGVLTVSDSGPMADQHLALSLVVRNQGGGPSSPTTLRYYRSTDATVTADDAEVGRDHVARLDASGSSAESVLTLAPSAPGTYHYGVCVDATPGETNTANNCSTGVAVTVSPFSMERLPWVQDGLTGNERRAYDYIQDIAEIDSAMARRIAGAPWLSDGVDNDELQAVLELRGAASRWPEVAPLLATIPDQTGDLMQDTLFILLLAIEPYADRFEWLLSQPWVQDGLTAEEAALIVTLRSAVASQDFFEDLVQNGQVWSETITLPLAGDVDLFAVGRSGFWLQSALDSAALAAQQSENLLQAPWPKSHVIMLVETEHHGSSFRGLGLNYGTHMLLKQPANFVVHHEVAHFYFSSYWGTRTPTWLTEGAANFAAHYTALKEAGGEISFRAAHLALKVQIAGDCDPFGVTNIQGWADSGLRLIGDDGMARRCPYRMGTHFLARLHHTLGHDAVSSALRELWETRSYEETTEDKIYQTFLSNTPPARQDEFRLLYHCLHGRPVAGYTAAPRAAPSSEVRDALVAVYNATNGPAWANNENWLSDAPLDEWHGVVTDCAGSVIALDLSENRLSGPVPPELGNLPDLGYLDLSGNQLSGEIPEELGKLAGLARLDLSENRLTGEIPAWLGGLSGLSYLNLGDNQLSGHIPPELGQLSGLNGPIPRQLGRFTGLGYLDLSKNQLSGPIPPELGRFTGLGYLDLSVNQLSGTIPPELGDLSTLREVHLNENQLSGEIPAELGKLANLERLVLWGNQLNGEIPAWLGVLSRLSFVSLGGNQLSGTIPPELGDLPNLEELYLYENRLSGPIPPELGNLASLDSLHLGGNQISGCIPAALKSVPRHDFDDVDLPFCSG